MESIRPLTAMGLMSGKSLDGVDAALLVTDGVDVFQSGAGLNRPYDMDMRADLKAVTGEGADGEALKEMERRLTLFHADVVRDLLDLAGLRPQDVDIIGFHGQTVRHHPEKHELFQIGDGELLARETGVSVVGRFAQSDVANGGRGGPVLSAYHAALTAKMEKPVAVVNIGGVANVTWIGENGELCAFDTGPGNAPIDDWVLKKCGMNFDFDGNLAASGKADEKIVETVLKRAYFKKHPPKAADRNDFHDILTAVDGLSPADGAATLTAVSARSIIAAVNDFLPVPPKKIVLCGGGAANPTLVRLIRLGAKASVVCARDVGWDGALLEAQGMAFLAARSLFGLPIFFPTTTGVPAPVCGGTLYPFVPAAVRNGRKKM